MKDGGVGQLGQLDHVTHQVGQLTALGVQADDVAISDITAKKIFRLQIGIVGKLFWSRQLLTTFQWKFTY